MVGRRDRGRYLLNRALALMWLGGPLAAAGDRWRGGARSTRSIGCCRGRFPIEPDLTYPWHAWAEIVGLVAGIEDPMARQVDRPALREPRRRADRLPPRPRHDQPRGLGLEVPGEFAERRTAEEWWGGGAGRSVTLAATDRADAAPMGAQAFVDQFAGDLGPDALAHHGRARWSAGRG